MPKGERNKKGKAKCGIVRPPSRCSQRGCFLAGTPATPRDRSSSSAPSFFHSSYSPGRVSSRERGETRTRIDVPHSRYVPYAGQPRYIWYSSAMVYDASRVPETTPSLPPRPTPRHSLKAYLCSDDHRREGRVLPPLLILLAAPVAFSSRVSIHPSSRIAIYSYRGPFWVYR